MSSTTRRLLTPMAIMAGLGLVLALAGDPSLFAFAVPASPLALTASASGSTVSLSWQSGIGGSTTYWLEAGSSPGHCDLGAWPTTGTSLVVPGVPSGRYWLRVRAASADGANLPSNEVDVRVGGVQ